MCNFNTLDEATKTLYHHELNRWAEAFGGKNFFLQMLETLRTTKPHPLTAKNCEFRFSQGILKWNKVIFKDKLDLLMRERTKESERNNLLPSPEAKEYKNVLNMIRTMAPISFEFTPNDSEESFTVQAFEKIDEKTTRLNPYFDALFFCAVDTVKKFLNYTPKA